MTFGKRMKELRLAAGLSQPKLAEMTGVSLRTIQNYESGTRKPSNIQITNKIAAALNADLSDLLDEQQERDHSLAFEAYMLGGLKAARDMKVLVRRVTAMFAGGDLDDADKDAAMRAISDAYWIAKDKNKKYTPKKHRKGKNDTGDSKQSDTTETKK